MQREVALSVTPMMTYEGCDGDHVAVTDTIEVANEFGVLCIKHRDELQYC